MQCMRCNGLMAEEEMNDYGESHSTCIMGWKCFNCGNLTDATIAENRKKPILSRGNRLLGTRTPSYTYRLKE